MTKKENKVVKRKQAAKKTGSEKKTTTENEKAETEAITQWLRTVD